MPVRMRHPGPLPDLSRLSRAPLMERWLLEPDDDKADGAVLLGYAYAHPRYPPGARVRTRPVEMIEDTPVGTYGGWAWSFSSGLWRLGQCIDLAFSRGVQL